MNYELQPLAVISKERLVQLTSSADCLIDVAIFALEHDTPLDAIDYLKKAKQILLDASDASNDRYWDTIAYPGGEDAFPCAPHELKPGYEQCL